MSYLCKRPKDSPDQPKVKFQESNAAKSEADKDTHTQPKLGESKSPVKENSCNNVATLTDAVQSTIEGDLILPTFQCFIQGRKLKGLKDSGCQSNFIVEKLASQLELKVIRDYVALTVNGINVPKFYKIKLVEAKVLIGKKLVKLQAYCLPSIGISLNLAKLGNIANKFVNKGYSLADPDLISRDCITNIEFILGVQSSYCLPETEVVFGNSGKSLYSNTHMAVILKGKAENLMVDISNLKPCDSLQSSCALGEVGVLDACDSLPTLGTVLTDDTCLMSHSVRDEANGTTFLVLDSEGLVNESELTNAANDILDGYAKYYINEIDTPTKEINEVN